MLGVVARRLHPAGDLERREALTRARRIFGGDLRFVSPQDGLGVHRPGVLIADVAVVDETDIGHPVRPARRRQHDALRGVVPVLSGAEQFARLLAVEIDAIGREPHRRAIGEAHLDRSSHALRQQRRIGQRLVGRGLRRGGLRHGSRIGGLGRLRGRDDRGGAAVAAVFKSGALAACAAGAGVCCAIGVERARRPRQSSNPEAWPLARRVRRAWLRDWRRRRGRWRGDGRGLTRRGGLADRQIRKLGRLNGGRRRLSLDWRRERRNRLDALRRLIGGRDLRRHGGFADFQIQSLGPLRGGRGVGNGGLRRTDRRSRSSPAWRLRRSSNPDP